MKKFLIYSQLNQSQNYYRVASISFNTPITYYGQYSLFLNKVPFQPISLTNRMMRRLMDFLVQHHINHTVEYYRNLSYKKIFALTIDGLIEINRRGHIFIDSNDDLTLSDNCDMLMNIFNQVWPHSKLQLAK